MRLRFRTVDVFTNRKFGGNPLAVVFGADELDGRQMQAIAAEFNLAETTFVLPPKDPANSAEVRIFTPRSEMPFAGHPNIGTAFVLATERSGGDEMAFEEKAGLVPIEIIRHGSIVVGARLRTPQPLQIGSDADARMVAQACGIEQSDIDVARHRPCFVSCGVPFLVAEVRSRAALRAASPRTDVFVEHLPPDRATGILLYVRDTADGFDLQTRMFAPLMGIAEDPATGSANAALAGLLAFLEPEPEASRKLRIGQGFDLGRPSILEATAVKCAGRVAEMRIGGECVAMMNGFIDL